jgi:hypothetical protein
MEPDLGMLGQELFYSFGLVRRQVVQDDVNVFGAASAGDQLFQKGNEIVAGVPLSRLSL